MGVMSSIDAEIRMSISDPEQYELVKEEINKYLSGAIEMSDMTEESRTVMQNWELGEQNMRDMMSDSSSQLMRDMNTSDDDALFTSLGEE